MDNLLEATTLIIIAYIIASFFQLAKNKWAAFFFVLMFVIVSYANAWYTNTITGSLVFIGIFWGGCTIPFQVLFVYLWRRFPYRLKLARKEQLPTAPPQEQL